MASEACKTALRFLEKIPVYVIVSEDYFSITLDYQLSQ